MRDLGTLGGTESVAFDVDDAGRVVAASQIEPGRDRRVEVHAFLWEGGEMTDLGSLSYNSSATAISDRGLVVHASRTERERLRRVHVHAVLWEAGGDG